jgi:hypothetical protein
VREDIHKGTLRSRVELVRFRGWYKMVKQSVRDGWITIWWRIKRVMLGWYKPVKISARDTSEWAGHHTADCVYEGDWLPCGGGKCCRLNKAEGLSALRLHPPAI